VVKSLVIGANGFIGSHLVDGLAAAGRDVTAFDRFSSRGATFRHSASVHMGDFLNRGELERAVADQDEVYHFLSTTTPATAESDPLLDVRTNLAQTIELLEICSTANVKHFYFASTGGAIYGPQAKDEYAEDDRTLPVSPYAIGKLAIENYLAYFHATRGLESTVFRISNPYGTRQHANKKQGLIPIALRQVLDGKAVVQFGDGSMVRDYLYVEDLVRMILQVATGPRRHRLYNLGSGSGHTVTEVLDAIRSTSGIDFHVEVKAKPPTFIDKVVLNTTRFTSEFGRQELTPLHEGVRRTWEEMKEEPRG
jgi:UDP-glucose 4-epimerase